MFFRKEGKKKNMLFPVLELKPPQNVVLTSKEVKRKYSKNPKKRKRCKEKVHYNRNLDKEH